MINIIGCGPGGADYLTEAAKSLIKASDILVGAPHLLELADSDTADKIPVSACIGDALKAITEKHREETVLSVLVSGDPGIFSLAKSVIGRFGRSSCRVMPGISSVQTAFARAGLNWDDALIISAHHELPDIESIDPKATTKIALLSGRSDAQEWLCRLLDRMGRDFTVIACENLTLEDEKVTTLGPDDIRAQQFGSRCVFLIIRKDLME